MNRSLALVLALLVAFGCALLVLGVGSGRGPDPLRVAAGPEGAEPASDLANLEQPAPRRVLDEQVEPAPETSGAAPEAAPEEPSSLSRLSVKQPLEVRVVDPEGAPVMDARVSIRGHRTDVDPSTHFSYRGENPTARTDFDGRARLEHFSWVTQDGRVSSVDLDVQHEGFVRLSAPAFPVGTDAVHEVTLERGGVVALTAWIADPSRPVADVTIRSDWSAAVAAGDWEVEPSGRRTTDKFTLGVHQLRVEHVAEGGSTYFSDLVDLEVEPGGYEELFVELRPAARFVGEVDPRVPRPIVDGIAVLGILAFDEPGRPSVGRRRRTEVDADGRFVFEGLPQGSGQLLVLCRGWVSRKAPLPVDPPLEGWPPIEVPGDGTFTVPMEPTGSVRATVLGPDGRPVIGATVRVSPNYVFWGLGSSLVPGRKWREATGPDGIAEIDDIPPARRLFISAGHDRFQMRRAERLDTPTVAVTPGGRTLWTVELEAKRED